MSSIKRNKGERQEQKEQMRSVSEVLLEVVGHLLHFPISLIIPIGDMAYKWGLRIKSRISITCGSREDLYQKGFDILRLAQKDITVVSTIKNEDPPFTACASVGDKMIRDYFTALHGIAYRNLLNGNGKKGVKIVRYIDLSDPNKCQEAFSLLYYGTDVVVRPSKVPVEFLTADNRRVLIGFPSPAGELLNGIRLSGPDNCEAMVKWVKSYDPSSAPIETPSQLASEINNVRGKPCDREDCLCNIVDVLGDVKKPSKLSAEQFNHISLWYRELYEGDQDVDYRKHCYESLANFIRSKFHFPKNYSFLDIGCGHAFGARQLLDSGVRYFGLDVSEKMIEMAQGSGIKTVYNCDAIGALMKADPRARGFHRDAPKKFNVIACQGNTFDLFLGPVQKALALFLFDNYLEDGGILLFTGHEFSKGDETDVPRKLPVADIVYKLKWYGEYMKLVVVNPKGADAELIHHPCAKVWLEPFLGSLGYDEKSMDMKWFGPAGGEYYMWTFQRRKRPEGK